MDLFTVTEDVTPIDATVTLHLPGIYTETRTFRHSNNEEEYVVLLKKAIHELVDSFFDWQGR